MKPRFAIAVSLVIILPFVSSSLMAEEFGVNPAVENEDLPTLFQPERATAAKAIETSDAVNAHILQMRRRISEATGLGQIELTLFTDEADDSTGKNQASTTADKEFLNALDSVKTTQEQVALCLINGSVTTGPDVMSQQRAAALRYAVDRLEQVASTLERAELEDQAALARNLVESVQLDLTQETASQERPVEQANGGVFRARKYTR